MQGTLPLALCLRRSISHLKLNSNSSPYQSSRVYIQLLQRQFHHSPNGHCFQNYPVSQVSRIASSPCSKLLHRRTTNLGAVLLRPSSSEFCPPKTAEKFRQWDGVPKAYTLIYRSDFARYLVVAQVGVCVSIASFVATLLTMLSFRNQSDEEMEERKLQKREQFEESRREEQEGELAKAFAEAKAKYGHEKGGFTSSPEMMDFTEGGAFELSAITMALVTFAMALFRILRVMPVRIYMNNQNHCIGIHYGHLIPGKLTHHEFVAGTVRKVKSRFEFYSDALYVDGSKKKLILMEHYFRYPVDYNHLLGIKEDFMNEEVKRRARQNPSNDGY